MSRGRSQFKRGCVVFSSDRSPDEIIGLGVSKNGRWVRRAETFARAAGRSNTAKGQNPMSAAGIRSRPGRGIVRLGSGTPSAIEHRRCMT